MKLLVVRKDDFIKKPYFLACLVMFSVVKLSFAQTLEEVTPELSSSFLSSYPDSSLYYANRGIAESQDSIDFAIIKGQALRRLGQVVESKIYFQSLLALPLEERQQANVFNNLGKVQANLAEYDESASSFFEALKIMEKLQDETGQAFYLNNIGIVYDLQDDYTNALQYYQLSMKIKQRLGMSESLPSSYTNIGISLYHLGSLDSALYYHREALKGFRKLGKKNSIARSMNNIGFALMDLKAFDSALNYLKKAKLIREELGDQRGLVQTTTNMAQLFLEQGRTSRAWTTSEAAARKAIALELPELLKNAWTIQRDVLSQTNQFQQAFQWSLRLDSLSVELATLEKSKKVAELEARYQNIKKEKELESRRLQLINKETELQAEISKRNFLIFLTVVLLVAVVAIYFGYRQKNRANVLFKAQNLLLHKEGKQLFHNREVLKQELDRTKLELEERDDILQNVYKTVPEDLPPHLMELSKREMEVLSYLSLGWSDREISDKLFISITTTKTHLRRIYSKLLVKSRAEAVSLAHRHGILGVVDA